jgi:hypothetical protein
MAKRTYTSQNGGQDAETEESNMATTVYYSDDEWLERRISDWMSYEPDLGTDDETMPADDITEYS